DLIEVGPFLAVDLDVDKQLIHQRGDALVLEGFVRHHVAPVTGGIPDRKEDRLVLGLRAGERLFAPRVPVDRIARVLEEIRARLPCESIGHWCYRFRGVAMRAIRRRQRARNPLRAERDGAVGSAARGPWRTSAGCGLD